MYMLLNKNVSHSLLAFIAFEAESLHVALFIWKLWYLYLNSQMLYTNNFYIPCH